MQEKAHSRLRWALTNDTVGLSVVICQTPAFVQQDIYNLYYLYLRNWIASAATLPLLVCTLLWLLFPSPLQFVVLSSLLFHWVGNILDRWKITDPSLHGWNRDVNRKLKSPSFVELIFCPSASEIVIGSHFISLWQMSSCVDFRNLFDFWFMCSEDLLRGSVYRSHGRNLSPKIIL